MRGVGLSEEAIVATGGINSWKKDSSGLRTCWKRVVGGSETSCSSRRQDQPKYPGSLLT